MGLLGSRESAGLVIRTKEVQLLALKGRTVATRVRVPIESGGDRPLVQTIQKALAAAALKSKRLAVSIPSEDVLFRFFTIPVVPKAEYDSVVQFEARKYIPFKTDLLVWDYRAVPSADVNRLEVIFAAVPKESFNGIQSSLTATGVQPTIVEPGSLSLARLVVPVKGAPANEFICVVDVEPEAAHLAIIKNRLPYLTRDIDLLPSPEAPAQFSAKAGQVLPMGSTGLPGPAEAAGVDPRAQRVFSELSVSMDFFMREHPSTTISRVLLCGDESLVGPWCGWLSDQLHRPVELGGSLLASHVEGDLSLSFASAVGLLQAAHEPAGSSLDFLKRSLTKTSGAAPQPGSQAVAQEAVALLKTPKALIGVGLAVGCLFAAWFGMKVMVDGARHQLEQVSVSSVDPRWGLDRMSQEELDAMNTQATAQVTLLRAVMGQRLRIAAKLDALVRSLPDGVWLTDVDFQDQAALGAGKSQPRLLVSGSCFLGDGGAELGAIQAFEGQLKHNAVFFNGFQAAQLDQINAQVNQDPQRPYTYRTFQLNCTPGQVK